MFPGKTKKGFATLMIVNVIIALLDAWQPTVIKGNAAEIGALAESNEVCRT
jgi:hydroxyethylthiazole kinase-like sugar kinase family protein